MTRYNDEPNDAYVGMKEPHVPIEQLNGYREGVDRVLEYVASIRSYPKLDAELRWAIEERII